MRPVFLARGPSFRANHQLNSTVNLVDIYPLMCHLLDLKPGPNNGSFENVKDLLVESAQRINTEQNAIAQNSLSANEKKDNENKNGTIIKLVVNITRGDVRRSEDRHWREFLDVFGFYHGHFRFVHLIPLIILVMIMVTFFCLCRMEMSRNQEMGFSYMPLENNYICTRDIPMK